MESESLIEWGLEIPRDYNDYKEDFLLNDADSNILIEYHKKQ